MTDQTLWFATRGAGIVSLLLFTGVTVLGLATAGRFQRPAWPRFMTAELHRSLALLSLVFLAIHIATAVLDPFTSLGWVAALVPLASSYRPVPVAFGVIAVDLFVALVVTSLIRDRIGYRAWRAVHWLAYGSWPLAVAHGFTAGSDAATPWMLAIDAVCVLGVIVAATWRLVGDASNRSRLEEIARAGAVASGSAQRAGRIVR